MDNFKNWRAWRLFIWAWVWDPPTSWVFIIRFAREFRTCASAFISSVFATWANYSPPLCTSITALAPRGLDFARLHPTRATQNPFNYLNWILFLRRAGLLAYHRGGLFFSLGRRRDVLHKLLRRFRVLACLMQKKWSYVSWNLGIHKKHDKFRKTSKRNLPSLSLTIPEIAEPIFFVATSCKGLPFGSSFCKDKLISPYPLNFAKE